ncbi:hypothetical protein ACSBR1_017356 [Camellia fascicularis]
MVVCGVHKLWGCEGRFSFQTKTESKDGKQQGQDLTLSGTVVAVDIAIQKANGVWCGDKILKVRKADFGKESSLAKQE